MYTLTLTREDRKAIDWVGYRNWNGTDLYRLLWASCDATPNDIDWDGDGDITFTISDRVMWDIRENWEFEGRIISHFDDILKGKVISIIKAYVRNNPK